MWGVQDMTATGVHEGLCVGEPGLNMASITPNNPTKILHLNLRAGLLFQGDVGCFLE